MKHQNWTTVILFPRDLAIEIQALVCDQKPFFHRLFCPIQCTIQRVFTQKVVIHPQLLLFSRWYRVFPLVNPLKARLFIFMCFSVLLITAVNICSNIKKKIQQLHSLLAFPYTGETKSTEFKIRGSWDAVFRGIEQNPTWFAVKVLLLAAARNECSWVSESEL